MRKNRARAQRRKLSRSTLATAASADQTEASTSRPETQKQKKVRGLLIPTLCNITDAPYQSQSSPLANSRNTPGRSVRLNGGTSISAGTVDRPTGTSNGLETKRLLVDVGVSYQNSP